MCSGYLKLLNFNVLRCKINLWLNVYKYKIFILFFYKLFFVMVFNLNINGLLGCWVIDFLKKNILYKNFFIFKILIMKCINSYN